MKPHLSCKSFLIVWVSILVLGQAVEGDSIIHESATLGLTGQLSGWIMSKKQLIGSRFHIDQYVEVTKIGGHMSGTGEFFGAIISLNSFGSRPQGSPFTASEVVASVVFARPSFRSIDYRTPLSVVLEPGDYALVFGSGYLGAAEDVGAMSYLSQENLPGASYFFWDGSAWHNTDPVPPPRFVVEGITEVTISGYIRTGDSTAIEGVLVSADNGGGSGVTDANGYYELTVPYNWSGTVEPDKTGWSFEPENRTYNNVVTDQSGQDYTGTELILISGHVVDANGIGMEGAQVSANNGGGQDVTDANGYYELFVPPGWSGIVKPARSGWGFEPEKRTYSNITTDQIDQDYTAFQPTISGHITDANAMGIEGIVISADNGGGLDTSDANGFYEIVVTYGWSGTITPTKPGWGFGPETRTYSSAIVDQVNQDYTAFPPPIISGYALDRDGIGVSDVVITVTPNGDSTITETNGYYEILVPYNWSGSVTPERQGWKFVPDHINISHIIVNRADVNFESLEVGGIYISKTYTVSSGSDDGHFSVKQSTGEIRQNLSSKNLDVGKWVVGTSEYLYTSGMRFVNIDIPKKADIRASNLKLKTYSCTGNGDLHAGIRVENNANPPSFSQVSISNRATMSIGPSWDHPASSWVVNQWRTSPSIFYLIQRLIDLAGWKSGNSIVVIYRGYSHSTYHRCFYSYNGGNAPKLEITYEYPPKISGHIKTLEGAAVAQVVVGADSGGMTVVTDSNGYYELRVPPGWTGKVTPNMQFHFFDANERTYTGLYTDRRNQDFTCIQGVVISGTVTNRRGAGVDGVEVAADNGGYFGITDGNGFYEFAVLPNWSGIITPNKEGRNFTPKSRSYSNLTMDLSDQNFLSLGLLVKADGNGDFPTIQAAVDAAVDADEVILETGTYSGEGNCGIDFKGKAITVRSIEPNNTAVVAVTIIVGHGFYFRSGEGPDSVVDGLTITQGVSAVGGGIHCRESSPTIRNCIIRDCFAISHGGGIGLEDSNAVISNCIVTGNLTTEMGGGIACVWGGSPSIINCIITANSVYYAGGGIASSRCNLTISNCTLVGNKAKSRYDDAGWGGALSIAGNANITNCILWGNDANVGPEIQIPRSYEPPTVTVSYCDVRGGEAAAYIDASCTLNWDDDKNLDTDPCFAQTGFWHPNDAPLDANDDFWVNGDYHLKSEAGRWKSSIYLGLNPTGDSLINLLDFAAFADSWLKKGDATPADLDHSGIVEWSDLRLLLDNYLDSYTTGEWVSDNVTSPCIDAGDPGSDWTAELWPHCKRINMGAYGGTREASMSPAEAGNIADLDSDGSVDDRDKMLFTDKWLYEAVLLTEDLDRNGFVNFNDFAIFANNWRLPSIQASNPYPAPGETNVGLNVDLSWKACPYAALQSVYFGTSSTPPLVWHQTHTVFEPPTMTEGSTYYWRIDQINPWGTTTGTLWNFATMSLDATYPDPADGAAGVSATADLSWKAGPYATLHNVYFGTSNPLPFLCSQPSTICDPGRMDYSTTYYWRIDEISTYGTAAGTVWSFTTIPMPPPAPASSPYPADGATGIGTEADLSWTAGLDAASHDLYFGTDNPPPFILNQTETVFDPGILALSTTYYWRIDGINSEGKTTGTLWTFTTVTPPPPPGQARNPSPDDGATGVGTDADLSWSPGLGATSHDVYFGTSNPPPFIGNQTAAEFEPGTMTKDTIYYWRIDEIGVFGKIPGQLWSFDTYPPPPPPPPPPP